jgi:hypothetical protein
VVLQFLRWQNREWRDDEKREGKKQWGQQARASDGHAIILSEFTCRAVRQAADFVDIGRCI